MEPLPRGLDAYAQAGMIKGVISRQHYPYTFHVWARYSFGQERKQGIREMTRYTLPRLGTGAHNRRLTMALVERYYRYDQAVLLKDLAHRFNLHVNTITERKRRVSTVLEALESIVTGVLMDEFWRKGLLK
jgi:hypothetical protein